MADILTFRPRTAAVRAPLPPSPAQVRARIEEAAQAALDTADSLLRILDCMDGDADAEDGGDAEPTLAAPENHHGSQVVCLRGNDEDREAEAPEAVRPNMAANRTGPLIPPLPWRGSGNVVAAVGVMALALAGL